MKENIINDAKNFIEALTLMNEGKAFDININIPVSGGAFYDCLAVNGEICAAHPSPIFFWRRQADISARNIENGHRFARYG